MNVKEFWNAVLQQDADAIREYFHPTAFVNWHNTNEHFTVEEFVRANCEYPGEWDGHRKAGFKELGVEDGFLQMMITKEDYLSNNP